MVHTQLSDETATSGFGNGESGFSLVLGGPLYQLYLRAGLARNTLELVHRRIFAFLLICWFVPLVLSLFAGHLVGGVPIPFLFDADVQARFLGALPLLIWSELFVHRRMRNIVQTFLDRGIIAEEDRGRFEDLGASAMRLRDSVLAEIVMLLFALTVGYWVWRQYLTLGLSNWCILPVDGAKRLTVAGYWYSFVSVTILRFLFLRWYFRLFIWYRFLWRVRSLPLHLNLFHPDRAGGLGFLGDSAFAFGPMLVAQSIVMAGIIGNRIWHQGARLPNFEMDIIGITVLQALLVLAPLFFFSISLLLGRRTARRELGALASRYVCEFRSKWIHPGNGQGEGLLGSSDIQSLADLANSYSVVSEMRIVPFNRNTLAGLLILIVSPVAPLVLTMIPLKELIHRLIGLAV